MPKKTTLAIHASDKYHRSSDVVPPINISTTYCYESDPAKLQKPVSAEEVLDEIMYSRLSHPNSIMVEETIAKITGAHAVVYNSGVSSFFALMTHVNPKKLFIGEAYHGCHAIADIWTRNHGLKQLSLSDEDMESIEAGDLVHIETPINPSSLCLDIQEFARKAHAKGAVLSVDSTFAALQDPFEFGADFVMHSATKYFGGHSDLLAGLLLTKSEKTRLALQGDRIYLGTNIANLEAALLLRSLKTFELRVKQQAANALKVVTFLAENVGKFPELVKVNHSSLQKDAFVEKQLKGIHSPTFSIHVKTETFAKYFPSKLKYFFHATSLGGVESLVEWRVLSDPEAEPTILRLSIGLEDAQDLIDDLTNAFTQ